LFRCRQPSRYPRAPLNCAPGLATTEIYASAPRGMDLVYQGILKLKEKWPTLTEEDAALLVGEMVVAYAVAAAEAPFDADKTAEIASRFASVLIDKAVNLAFGSFRNTADMDARLKAEWDAEQLIKSVLRDRVRDLGWRLSRERRSITA
jgi:hypothetical protein